ncbi:MAG: SAM-dependent methyltransferase [Chloroflexota bacterium]
MNQLIMTCDPDFFLLAQRELDEATQVDEVIRLDEGVYLTSISESFWELAAHWQVKPPIFVRHICPVQKAVPLQKNRVDLTKLAEVLLDEIVPLLDSEFSFSIQSRTLCKLPYKRFDLNNILSDAIQQAVGAPLDVRQPAQIVSVVCAEVEKIRDPRPQGTAFLGVSLASHNLSDWAGGMRRFAREEEQVSRSEFKLLEALEVFGIELPPRGTALDLGASPGGWTRVLRQQEQYVTAVDPGGLAPSVYRDRSVRHKRITAEVYLQDEPDTFDIIVNDMRVDARDSARLMNSYAKHIYRHGLAIMTLKLPEHGREKVIDHAMNILQQTYTIEGARQLFHNRSEITVYLKPQQSTHSEVKR